MSFLARYWHMMPNGKIQCELCPRYCNLKEGQRGLCFVRKREADKILLDTYGRSSGFCIDPIEKKPLNHFFPGTAVLSFGTAGCNLSCKFCQNWDISKAREMDRLMDSASPLEIAKAAKENACKSIAFTYNDPVIFLEYALDVAKACKDQGIKTVAVSAGYINKEPRKELFEHMDAANIDLKAFSNDFYKKLCGGSLKEVLETLKYIKHETETWLEITTLIIPGQNDSDNELAALSDWLLKNLGDDVPLHFTAFHPDHKMTELPMTSLTTLKKAQRIARASGIKHVYTGNVNDPEGSSSYCSSCGSCLIARDRYTISQWELDENGSCKSCGKKFPGHFSKAAGNWGAKRKAIRIAQNLI